MCYYRCCHSAIKIDIVERVSNPPTQFNCEAWIQRKEQVSMYRHVNWWWSYVMFSFGASIQGMTNYQFDITWSGDVWMYGLIFLFRVRIDPSGASGSVPSLEPSSWPRSVSSLKPGLSPSGFPSSNHSVDPSEKPTSVLSLEPNSLLISIPRLKPSLSQNGIPVSSNHSYDSRGATGSVPSF